MKANVTIEQVPVTTYKEEKKITLEVNEIEANLIYQLLSKTHGDSPEVTHMYNTLSRFASVTNKRHVQYRPGPSGGIGAWTSPVKYDPYNGEVIR